MRRCICKRPQDEHQLKDSFARYRADAMREGGKLEWFGKGGNADDCDFSEPAPHPSKG